MKPETHIKRLTGIYHKWVGIYAATRSPHAYEKMQAAKKKLDKKLEVELNRMK